MHIYRNIDHLPAFRRAVVTIGTFDGVHTGHQQILEQLRQEAARIDGETVIITFHPHPRKIVKGAATDIRLLNTLQEKIGLLSEKGIDHLVIVPFTEAFSQLTAEQYVQEFLLGKFHPHTIIIGYDHQFGKGRAGDYHLLEDFSRREGFHLQEIPVHLLNEISVSSTRIREAIVRADLDTANRLLGYDFFFTGLVVDGNKLGRTLGYPTANLQIEDPEKLIPGDGIYAVEVTEVPEQAKENALPTGPRMKGMMSIGIRPTIGGTSRVIEVNIFDFNGDLYGKQLRVYMKKYLRAEEKFPGLDELKQQLAKDKEDALAALR
jgi:riboflavin kinase/FMN adenylyltransferase